MSTTDSLSKKWFTSKEAAAYLSVSEPTIFRWMKEGLISHYKMGGATRFSAQSLDAFVEKTTGTKEAEALAETCAACGHHVLVKGNLQGIGRLYFRPEKTKFWTLSEGLAATSVKACAACGFIAMYADTQKIEKLKPTKKTKSKHKKK